MSDLTAILRITEFLWDIMGSTVRVIVTVRATYETTMEFSLLRVPYSFIITRWSRKGFLKFVMPFFQYTTRDPEEFGTLSESTDGVNINMTTDQKVNTIIQATKDIMSCLNTICRKHQRSVLDYAVWYRERNTEYEPYDNYITRVTCHCIVHTDFIAPNITWQVVKFGMQ